MSNEYFYKEFPKTCVADDFWGQVRRTVNGKPVGEEQIAMIVDAVRAGLDLNATDCLLDLCCGNGALTTRIFAHCRGGLGVDFAGVLIEVAQVNFSRPGRDEYLLEDVEAFVNSSVDTERFTKGLCYGSFQYLPESKARAVLSGLRVRFPGISRMFIGNLPDRERISSFYRDVGIPEGRTDDPGSPVGIWRTQSQFADLAHSTGWDAEFRQMPAAYYAAHYRFDAVLIPADRAR
jgi:hypothetical protein